MSLTSGLSIALVAAVGASQAQGSRIGRASKLALASQCKSDADCNRAKCPGCSCIAGSCACGGGWSGPSCGTPYCTVGSASGCGNGTCIETNGSFKCQCQTNFTGFRCAEKICTMTCKHGSLPNADCTGCSACVGGWSGQYCDIWNSNTPNLESSYKAHFTSMRLNVMQMVKEVDSPYEPLPGWQQVAASVNSVTGQPATPFLEFSFDQAKFWTDSAGVNFSVPDDMQITSGFVPSGHPQTPVALLQPSSAIAGQIAQIEAHAGTVGFLGGLTDPDGLLKSAFAHGVSLAVYTTTYPVYDLRVPNVSSGSPVKLSRYARAAIESLPPIYDQTTEAVFISFIEIFGTSYATTATYGGADQTVLAWPSCLWKGAHPDPKSPGSCLLDQSNLAAHTATRDFGGSTRTFAQTRFGGDPSVNGTNDWVKSVPLNPIGVGFQGVSLASLLTDYNSEQGTALDKAIAAYISNASTSAQARGSEADTAAAKRAQPVAFGVDGGSTKLQTQRVEVLGQNTCGPSLMAPGDSHDLSCPDKDNSKNAPDCSKYTIRSDLDAANYGAVLKVSNDVSKDDGDPASCGCSWTKAEVLGSSGAADAGLHSCGSGNTGQAYSGDEICEVHDVYSATDCCSVCENHRSCKKWTHDYHGNKCSLHGKDAESHFEVSFFSDERQSDPSDDAFASLCFDCSLSALSWIPPDVPPATDSFPRLRL